MARRINTRRWALALAAIVLAINTFLPARAADGQARGTNPLERWASHVLSLVLSPVREPLYLVSTSMRPGRSLQVVTSHGQAALKKRLAAQLTRTNQLEQRIGRLKREVQRLTGSRQLVQLESVQLTPANVTGLTGDPQSPMLELDAGRSDGIRAGLAVVAGAALVGRVQSASQFNARVRLITTAETAFRVRIQPADADQRPGAVVERIRFDTSGDFFTVDIPLDTTMQVGDLAHLADERWPWPARGFVVGKVVEFRRHPKKELLLKRAVIHPIPALRSLSRVAVLVPDDS